MSNDTSPTRRYIVKREPPPEQRPRSWRPFQRVYDTHTHKVHSQYRTWGMATEVANALNAGRPLPAESAAERWGWSE